MTSTSLGYLQRSYFQISSHWQILGVKTSTSFWGIEWPSSNFSDRYSRTKWNMVSYFLWYVYGHLSSEVFGQYDISGSWKSRKPRAQSPVELVNLRLILAYRWRSSYQTFAECTVYKRKEKMLQEGRGKQGKWWEEIGYEFSSLPGPQLWGSVWPVQHSGTLSRAAEFVMMVNLGGGRDREGSGA